MCMEHCWTWATKNPKNLTLSTTGGTCSCCTPTLTLVFKLLFSLTHALPDFLLPKYYDYYNLGKQLGYNFWSATRFLTFLHFYNWVTWGNLSCYSSSFGIYVKNECKLCEVHLKVKLQWRTLCCSSYIVYASIHNLWQCLCIFCFIGLNIHFVFLR